VLEALGVNVTGSAAQVERCLHEIGLAFFFAPTFHPAMRHAAQVRRDLGIRTAFNLLGPLTNPAGASRQIVGVPRPELTELIARALLLLGSERAWVVHGADGLDELSTTGYTKVSECRDGAVQTFYVHPADYGLPKSSLDTLRGGDAAENARRIRDVLDGVHGPARQIVLLNAGAALLVAGRVDSVRAGIARAEEAIDAGRAKAMLSSLVAATQSSGSAS
jgi:anthranilate phosphoribosyltransferase